MPLPGSSVVQPIPQPEPDPEPVAAVPVPEPEPLPLPLAPHRETPLPAGERVDLEPRARRKRSPYWLLGGFGVVAAATLAIVVGTNSSSGSNTTKPATTTKPEVLAQTDVPKPDPARDDAEAAVDESSDEASPKTGAVEDPDGPPMIGDGPCKLTVATTPAGSKISLDNKELAPSPITIATTCEKHRIEIAHARYQTAIKTVTLEEASPGTLEVSLNRPTHAVSFTSTPPGATIFVDGRRAGTTPTVVNVVGFQRLKIELKKTGYQPQSVSLYSKVPKDKVGVKLTKW
jgi:hypothetical protein